MESPKMANISSILSGIGNALKKIFGVAVTVAQAAEPIMDIAFPGIATLYNLTVSEVAKAEGLAVAAGAQTGSGPQKLAMVIASIEPVFAEYATTTGIPDAAQAAAIENWVNAVVASLNAIPAPPPAA